ncbi:MAG: nucleoside deaminase [Clostridia bacterium]|nr:nucleoside deaminase [Clostridia bacterium]
MELDEKDALFMEAALEEARAAAAEGEVPVGAVVVRDGVIIGRGRNRRELGKNALAHAEIIAIDEACRNLGGWRLPGCTLYVTLEPCPMCAGAIISARIPRVVSAVRDAKAGAFGSVLNMNSYPLNHKTQIEFGVLAQPCGELLSDFFAELRKKLRNR